MVSTMARSSVLLERRKQYSSKGIQHISILQCYCNRRERGHTSRKAPRTITQTDFHMGPSEEHLELWIPELEGHIFLFFKATQLL